MENRESLRPSRSRVVGEDSFQQIGTKITFTLFQIFFHSKSYIFIHIFVLIYEANIFYF